jgi:hypothetical protein
LHIFSSLGCSILGVITLKLEGTVERRLRERAADLYDLTRGSLSRAVEDALMIWFRSGSSLIQQRPTVRYFAFRGGKSLLEAPSLKELANRLKKAGIDPQDVEMRSADEPPSSLGR